jgi:hypothetical protein
MRKTVELVGKCDDSMNARRVRDLPVKFWRNLTIKLPRLPDAI